jgi:protein phosphatase
LLIELAADAPAARKGQTPFAQALSGWLESAGGEPSAAGLLDELRRLARTAGGEHSTGFIIGSQSVTGRVREINEDSIFVEDYAIAQAQLGLPMGIFAVADGVGGQAAGEVASRIVVESLALNADEFRIEAAKGTAPDPKVWLVRAATAANESVHSRRVADRNDMGSTLVMAVVIGRTASLLNVGDSRAYRLSAQGAEQITTDHSLVQRLVELGQLTREEAHRHPQRSVIYRVIGDKPEVVYDLFTVTLGGGDALLLCSDGLTDVVRDEALWSIWHTAATPQQACDRLVESANQAGGPDNISVIIVQMT